jgi:hypothetical protein
VPTGWTINSGQGTYSLNVTVGTNSGQVCATPSNSYGSGTQGCLYGTVSNNTLGTATISGPSAVCVYSSSNYTVTANNATSYNWTVPADWSINSGQGTSIINVYVGSMPGQVCCTPSNSCGNGTQACKSVTIGASQPVPSITQTYNTLSSNYSGATYAWYLNGVLQPTKTTQTISISSVGSWVVVVTNSIGCSETSQIFSSVVGINEISKNSSIEIYPNPSNGIFTLSINGLQDEEIQIRITNVVGEEIYKTQKVNVSGNYSKEISLQNTPKGIYFVQIIDQNNNAVNRKIVIE